MNTVFTVIWIIFGVAAGVLSLRHSARFNRALALKYGFPVDGLSPGDYAFAVVYALLGPAGVVGVLALASKYIVGESYWAEAKDWTPSPEWQAQAARKAALVPDFR